MTSPRLVFNFFAVSPSGKTSLWSVQSSDIPLGEIRWYAPWRKYIFAPGRAVFDSSCLLEIVAFLDEQTLEQKRKGNS